MHDCHTAAGDEWELQLWRQVSILLLLATFLLIF
jgi:hypothetical protein